MTKNFNHPIKILHLFILYSLYNSLIYTTNPLKNLYFINLLLISYLSYNIHLERITPLPLRWQDNTQPPIVVRETPLNLYLTRTPPPHLIPAKAILLSPHLIPVRVILSLYLSPTKTTLILTPLNLPLI
jgi:hypothetical protein